MGSSKIIHDEYDDEFDEWEKANLSESEEMYVPLPQIDDDWEAMYWDCAVESNVRIYSIFLGEFHQTHIFIFKF